LLLGYGHLNQGSGSILNTPLKRQPKNSFWAEEFFERGNYKRAIDEYRKILKKFSGSPFASRAQLSIGQSYYKMNKFDQALESYQKVINDYSLSEVVKEALQLEERLAEEYLEKKSPRQFLIPQHDRFNKAAQIYQQIVDNFPFQSRAAELQYNVGWVYYKAGNFKEAIKAFEKVKKNYPRSAWNAKSSFMIGLVYWTQSPERLEYHQDAVNKAVDSFQSFIKDYPDHPKVKDAEKYLSDLKDRQGKYLFNIGEYYYKKEGSLKAASVYFKKLEENFKGSSWGEKAKERLAEIGEIERRIKEGKK